MFGDLGRPPDVPQGVMVTYANEPPRLESPFGARGAVRWATTAFGRLRAISHAARWLDVGHA
jgi:hypothetical protein